MNLREIFQELDKRGSSVGIRAKKFLELFKDDVDLVRLIGTSVVHVDDQTWRELSVIRFILKDLKLCAEDDRFVIIPF